MKSLKKILYFVFIILIISNIFSIISNWNTVAVYSFLGFETNKVIYLIIQLLFIAAFGSSLYAMIKKDKNQETPN
ncbi:hypothetical protein [Mongoliitalea daihaiensis]|uniref:hypothetical protein n=1 Tax=Mongoliitalea daihaiensis TaxID=2782006 RepID=UPI001F382BB2|nr:hypothetical protein [Mongoliitalea daihaiensis]UJP66699.1 hypothetical protein IPZ59_08985 [Mongoliitalea daihaiensis]